MKRLTPMVLVVLTAFMLSGCGGDYTATNTTRKESNGGGTGTVGPGPVDTETPQTREPTGPSMVKEYRREMEAAFAAHDDYEEVRRDPEARKEPYIKWAEHLYAALAYANIHERNGYSKSDLPRYHSLKKLRSGDFKYAQGPSDDPRVRAAIQNWTESTN